MNKNRMRKNQILFFVTEDEKWFIQEKMKAVHMNNMGAFIRKMLIEGKCIYHDYSAVFTQLKEINYHVCAISKNINQIAKRVNSCGNLYKNDLEEIEHQLNEIKHMQIKFTKKYVHQEQE